MRYYSQYDQDRFIDWVVLNRKKDGFFIDIGAYDGVLLSNTYFFETFRGFQGICFEPNPAAFANLNRTRRSLNINACVGKKDATANFLCIKGYGQMLSGLVDYYDPKHMQRVEQTIEEHGGGKEFIEVKVVAFNSLIDVIPQRVDFCSIDTEGNEFSILESIDFEYFDIKCLTIENNYNDSQISRFLLQKNFVMLKRLGCDDIYIQKNMLCFSLKVRQVLFQCNSRLFVIKRRLYSLFASLK